MGVVQIRFRGIPGLILPDKYFADPVGSIGSIHPNPAQGLYNWFTIFVMKDLTGLLHSPSYGSLHGFV